MQGLRIMDYATLSGGSTNMANGSDFNGRPFLSSDHLKYLCFRRMGASIGSEFVYGEACWLFPSLLPL